MQGGHAHGGTGNNNGLQHGKRCGAAGATNRNLNVVEDGVAFFGCKLERNSPSWSARCEAKLLALSKVVELDYCPIDLVVKVVAIGFGAGTKCFGLFERIDQLVLGLIGNPSCLR